ncbi:tetratricopeptide repeat protein [Dasania marina]|uniref:tetratricopeptide repeat protein n=1 Tax=Dasania marina TaxID=471499 RepID=UPI0030DB9AFA
MSLVNDMLNDLEKRRVDQPAQSENLEWLTAQAPARKKTKRPWYALLLVLTLATVAIVLWQQYRAPSSLVDAQKILIQAEQAKPNDASALNNKSMENTSPAQAPAQPTISAINFEPTAEGLQVHIVATQSLDYQLTNNQRQLAITFNQVLAQLPPHLASAQAPVSAVSFRPYKEGMVLLFDLQQAVLVKRERQNGEQLSLLLVAKPSPVVSGPKPVAIAAKPVAIQNIAPAQRVKTSTPLTVGQQDTLTVKEANSAIRSGDEAAAEVLLRRFIQRHPQALASQVLLVELLIKQNRHTDAQAALDTQPNLVAQASALRRLQAHLLVLNQQPEKAVQLLLSKQPDLKSETPYYELLAMAAQRAKQYPLSIQVYKSLLRFDSGQGSWWVGLAISQELAGLKADARADFLQAMRAGRINQSLRDYARSRYEALAGAVNVYPSSTVEGANGE